MNINYRQVVESHQPLMKCSSQVGAFSVSDLLRIGRLLKVISSEVENYRSLLAQLRKKHGTFNSKINESGVDESYLSFNPEQSERLEADHLLLLKEEIEVPLKNKFPYTTFERLIDVAKHGKDSSIQQLSPVEVISLDWMIDLPDSSEEEDND